MPWYVFALVDGTPSGAKGRGLSGPLGLRKIPGGFAVVERRADIPPAEFGSLKLHHDVVAKLASRVDAILPVRFGTLLDADAIDEALDERDEEIADAFAVVRGRVQFTWRRAGSGKREAGSWLDQAPNICCGPPERRGQRLRLPGAGCGRSWRRSSPPNATSPRVPLFPNRSTTSWPATSPRATRRWGPPFGTRNRTYR